MKATISNGRFFGGLSGLQLRIPQYQFPPPFEKASRLEYYATFFNSIEINSSFYRLPMPSTVRKWKDVVPERFKFTFKLWKEITHCKGLLFESGKVAAFFKAIEPALGKHGCILVQLPPSSGYENFHQLEKLLEVIMQSNTNREWKIAIEFRNKSWYRGETYDMLNAFNSTYVAHDIPKSAITIINELSDFVYLRFHGPTGNYRDSYTDDFLSEYASYISDWMKSGKTVYTYFNNTMGNAFENMLSLNKLVNNHFD